MNKKLHLFIRITIALILLQTLRYKFTAHPDSVYIFTTLGLEPFGRIGIGILELITSGLLLFPRTIWLGAVLSVGLMAGAIMAHITQIGIEVHNDDGLLFYTALGVFILSVIVLFQERKNIPFVGSKL